jgi:drug/metabolite transporter (DMT)-like permease
MVLSGAVLISFSAVFVKLAHVSPTMAGFYRNLIGGLVLVAILAVRRERLWKDGWYLLGCMFSGLIFAADLFTWHISIHATGPGLATILANFQVFFMAAFGVLVFKEKLTLRLLLAMPLAVAGLFLLAGVQWRISGANYQVGVLMGLAAALFYAFYMQSLRRLQTGPNALSAMAVLAVVSFVSAAFLGAAAWQGGDSFVIPDRQSLLALLAYGVFCQVVGWVFISRGLPKIPSSLAGLLILLQPSLAFTWDILFFKKRISLTIVLGALITLTAIYMGAAGKRKMHPLSKKSG